MIHNARLFAIYVALGAFPGTESFELARRVEPQFLALTAALGLGLPALFITLELRMGCRFCPQWILGVIAVSMLLQRFHAAGFIDFLGQHALEIYVGHTIGSAGARIMLEVFHIKSSEIHFTVGIGGGLGIPLAIFYVFKIVGFQYGFTFPKRKPRLADALWHKIASLPLVTRTTNGKRVDSPQDAKK